MLFYPVAFINVKKLKKKPIKKNDGQDTKSSPFFGPSSIQTKSLMPSSGKGERLASKTLSTQLNNTKGSGAALPEQTNHKMSHALGNDFSQVKIHTGREAIQMNQDLGAKAFTHGSNVYFNKGQYNPNSASGKKLLAHELTHVVQQKNGTPSIQRACLTTAPPADEKLYTYTKGDKTLAAKFRDAAGAQSFINRHSDLNLKCYKMGSTYDVYIKPGAKPKAPSGGETTAPVESEGGSGTVATEEETTSTDPAEIKFALTFDDGPHTAGLKKGINRTEKVLDVLAGKGIKAGFFIQTHVTHRGANPVGRALVKRMDDEGHAVGVHTGGTRDHELHTKAQKAGRLQGELEAGKAYIKDQTGEDATYVRPPRGVHDKQVLNTYNRAGLTNIMWDLDGDQGADLSETVLKKRVVSGLTTLKNNNWTKTTPLSKIVILYHDIQLGTSTHIGTLIDYIKTITARLTKNKSKAKFEKP